MSVVSDADAVDSRKAPVLYFAEPFRIFFPLGLLLGVIGVALWPLFVWQAIDFYPANAHSRFMIEGLMGSFIIGFLGTAGPRLLDARPLSALETSTLLVLQILSALFHLAQNQAAGDIIFLVLLLFFSARWPRAPEPHTICRHQISFSFSSDC
jgi:uncharacterized protein involved in response to NO